MLTLYLHFYNKIANDVHNVIHLPKVCYCSCHPIFLPSNIPKVQSAYIGRP